MLPRSRRVTRGDEFRRVMRRGRRAGRPGLVVHALPGVGLVDGTPEALHPRPARAGFVVGRSVGNAVVRHRVTRRLRHLLAARLEHLDPGTEIVVRALPPAADASSAALAADLDAAWARLGLRPPRAPERGV